MGKTLLTVLGAAVATAAWADAFWFGGSGCLTGDALTDTSKWSSDPRHSAETSGPWCYFWEAKEGDPHEYAVTLSEDLRVNAVFQLIEGLTVHMRFAPHTFYTSFGDAMRLERKNAVFSLESGTICSRDLNGTYRPINFWDGVQGAAFRVDGPTTVLDAPINMRGGYGGRVVVTNGAHMLHPLDIHGYSDNLAVVSGAGTYVDYDGQDLNVGGWHKQSEVIAGTKTVTNNCLHVTDGAEMRNANRIRCGYYGSFSLLNVDGGVVRGKSAMVGETRYASNNVLRVAHGAAFELSDTKHVLLGASRNTDPGPCGNSLVFEGFTNDCTKLTGFMAGTDQDWQADYGLGCSNNTVRISGSEMRFPAADGRFYVGGGANNGVAVSDGSVVCTGMDQDGTKGNGAPVIVGDGNHTHGAYLTVAGAGTVFSNFNQNVGVRMGGRNARGCRFEVLDGATFYNEKNVSAGFESAYPQGGGHLVRVAGGLLKIAEGLNLGQPMSAGGAVASNLVEVADGGTLEVKRLRLRGQGNAVTVSNATLRVQEEFYPVYGNNEDAGRDTVLTFAGTHPHFVVEGNYNYFYRGTTLAFVVPAEGYRTVPFERTVPGTRIIFDSDDTDFRFDLSALARNRETVRTVLMKAPGGFQCSEAQWTRLQANLPANCQLYQSDDAETLAPAATGGTLLVLKVPGSCGTRVFVR